MSAEKFRKEAGELVARCVERIGEGVASLVGAQVGFSAKEIGPVLREDVSRKVKKTAAVLSMSSASGAGRGLAVFRLPEAFVLAGTLLMVPANQIKELVRSPEMGQDMADAFTEVANIVYGAVDGITNELSAGEGKLKNEGIQLVDVSSGKGFATLWTEGPTFGAEIAVAAPGYEPGPAFLVFEAALLARILGMPDAVPAAPAASPRADGTAGAVLLFGRDAAIAGEIREFLAGRGIEAMRAENLQGALEMISGLPLLVLVEFPPDESGAAVRLCRAASDEGRNIPVVGVTQNPTKETILQALKAGVRSFLVHPFTPEALHTKLDPLLEAAKT
jgi:CheY-like chemotaxis protein